MKNLKLTLQYDGTKYHGYQIQPQAVTIQKCIQDAIFSTCGEQIQITGCSRTDAGVHAAEYVCSFKTDSPIPAERFPIVINHKLPDDIYAMRCEKVDINFNARFDTKYKTYRYLINESSAPNVFRRNYEWQLGKKLDTERMTEAAEYIIGKHDFKCFMTSGAVVQSTVRTVYSLDIVKNGDQIEIYISADGYLYNMVRIIVGTLVNVGTGVTEPEHIKEIIESHSRENAGATAPPQGLYLYKVVY